MKKFYIILGAITLTVTALTIESANANEKALSAESPVFSSGHQAGLTGAPGENNCTQCHSGSTLSGVTENQFTISDSALNVVSEYIPGKTYTASLQLASNPAKKGFSSTTMDVANDSMAGSLSGITIGGTSDFQNGGSTRSYVSHTSTSNTSATTTWTWTWVAPASDIGDVVFYIASNVTNDDGSTAGDQIYLSQHTITPVANTVGVSKIEEAKEIFSAGYNAEENKVVVNFNSLVSNKMFFNLVDMGGKSVYVKGMTDSQVGENKHSVALPQGIENGIYIVNFFNGNKAMSAKIMVQK